MIFKNCLKLVWEYTVSRLEYIFSVLPVTFTGIREQNVYREYIVDNPRIYMSSVRPKQKIGNRH
jgi:hypothetical protein